MQPRIPAPSMVPLAWTGPSPIDPVMPPLPRGLLVTSTPWPELVPAPGPVATLRPIAEPLDWPSGPDRTVDAVEPGPPPAPAAPAMSWYGSAPITAALDGPLRWPGGVGWTSSRTTV